MSIANLPPHKHEWKSRITDQKSDFISRKRDEPSTFNQRFGFVDNQIMHASCHLPTSYVLTMGFWKKIHIKEM
jgi:hypothetical protein